MSSQTVKKCVLKRCQGKRGCICPTGTVIGTYAGRKVTQIINNNNLNDNVNIHVKSIEIPAATAMYNDSFDSGDSMNQLKSIGTMKGNRSNVYQTYNIIDNEKNNSCNTAIISNESQSSSSTATLSNLNKMEQDYSHFNGEVIIRYNHYKKKFSVLNGSTTSKLIDEQYFLSFVSTLLIRMTMMDDVDG